jgi:hypothetical protein
MNSYLLKLIKVFFLIANSWCFASGEVLDPNELPPVEWQFASTNFNISSRVYTPFFVDGQEIVLYAVGSGSGPNNGVVRLTSNLSGTQNITEQVIIPKGPDVDHYNYFRAGRVARHGSEIWMLIEVSGCYTGCDSSQFPKRLAVYRSLNNGLNWTFLDFANVDGAPYVAKWFAHTGLIYNADGSEELNLIDLTKNRFVTVGENRDIFISNDGINYKSIPMNHPFPKDRLVFASLAKTPFGFHLTSTSNWSDSYYTTTVRHLFSKDLKNWYPIESNSFLKNPRFYKGVHLSYDEKSKKLWAISPCGANEPCSFLAWLEPKDFLDKNQVPAKSELIPIGEFVQLNGRTAMVVERESKAQITTYRIRTFDGTFISGLTRAVFTFPLSDYRRQGCVDNNNLNLCIGDSVYVDKKIGSIVGFNIINTERIEYAVKYTDGIISIGLPRSMLSLP